MMHHIRESSNDSQTVGGHPSEINNSTAGVSALRGSHPDSPDRLMSLEDNRTEQPPLVNEGHGDRKKRHQMKEEHRRKRELRKRLKTEDVFRCHAGNNESYQKNLSETEQLNQLTFTDFLVATSDTPLTIFHCSSSDSPLILPLAADIERFSNTSSTVDFTKSMTLKKDHIFRPILICPTGKIYLETINPLHKPAVDFLVSIAEPLSRPEHIQEFQITVFSLYAAIGIGMTIDGIVDTLNIFSKNVIPDALVQLLYTHGNSFGRVKLVLRDSHYFLESQRLEDLEELLQHPVISEARIRNSMIIKNVQKCSSFPSVPDHPPDKQHKKIPPQPVETSEAPSQPMGGSTDEMPTGKLNQPSDGSKKKLNESGQNTKQMFFIDIKSDYAGRVKECALNDMKRPLLSEYDFRRDRKNPTLNVELRTTTKIRYYQERSLKKMFSNGRARSGIIVLPCGAGKTLTGITAATTIRKSCMVLTSSSVAVDQWKRSFKEFTTIDPSLVITLTSEKKHMLPEGAVVLISTYTMMAYSGKRSVAAAQIISQVRTREWGLLIFDEVQFAPAPAFRKINDIVKSHCKLGLTATLVREDDLIHDLQWLIGPKLYEANWLELQESSYLAKVQVSEVWCTMTAEFYYEYLRAPHAKQRKLWVCNPNKLRVCEYLIRFHEARNDKIIVFSDNLFALKEVACTLKKPFISGQVGMQERMIILNKFKTSPKLNTIFLSKVGDNAIDIPCANVVVQISFNFASRRQEAQRLGRILRPKSKSNETYNAFFYSLVSKDTQEMLYADKRQQFIIDQGYAYKVFPISAFPMEQEVLLYDDPQRQRDLLTQIMTSSDQCLDLETDEEVKLNDDSYVETSFAPHNSSTASYNETKSIRHSLSMISRCGTRL